MLSLVDTARVFDDQVFSDAYAVSPDFKGKILPFSDSTMSGPSVQRRILDVGSSVVIPLERVITSSGLVYVVAHGNTDFFDDTLIRTKYPVIPVDTQYYIRTIAQVLTNSGGVSGVYMYPSYTRRTIFKDQSEYGGGYVIYSSSYYSMLSGLVLVGGDRYYLTRENSRVDEAGFGAVEVSELPSPLAVMSVTPRGTYSPASDTSVGTPILNVSVFIVHYSLEFDNTAAGFVDMEAGDASISFLKSDVATISAGALIGDQYTVKSVTDNTDYWTIHGRSIPR